MIKTTTRMQNERKGLRWQCLLTCTTKGRAVKANLPTFLPCEARRTRPRQRAPEMMRTNQPKRTKRKNLPHTVGHQQCSHLQSAREVCPCPRPLLDRSICSEPLLLLRLPSEDGAMSAASSTLPSAPRFFSLPFFCLVLARQTTSWTPAATTNTPTRRTRRAAACMFALCNISGTGSRPRRLVRMAWPPLSIAVRQQPPRPALLSFSSHTYGKLPGHAGILPWPALVVTAFFFHVVDLTKRCCKSTSGCLSPLHLTSSPGRSFGAEGEEKKLFLPAAAQEDASSVPCGCVLARRTTRMGRPRPVHAPRRGRVFYRWWTRVDIDTWKPRRPDVMITRHPKRRRDATGGDGDGLPRASDSSRDGGLLFLWLLGRRHAAARVTAWRLHPTGIPPPKPSQHEGAAGGESDGHHGSNQAAFVFCAAAARILWGPSRDQALASPPTLTPHAHPTHPTHRPRPTLSAATLLRTPPSVLPFGPPSCRLRDENKQEPNATLK